MFSKRLFEHQGEDYQPMPEAEQPGGYNFAGEAQDNQNWLNLSKNQKPLSRAVSENKYY